MSVLTKNIIKIILVVLMIIVLVFFVQGDINTIVFGVLYFIFILILIYIDKLSQRRR